MNRRKALKAGVGVATVAALTESGSAAASRPRTVDTNVSLFRWPFRRLPLDETKALAYRLERLGVVEAWAGSFEGLLHRDIGEVNRRLAVECGQTSLFRAVGCINPRLPDWVEDLRRCAEVHGMDAVRLHPNYHGYGLGDPRFSEVLEAAASRELLVQITVALEDTRTQPELVPVGEVDLSPLPAVLRSHRNARVQLLNWRPRGGTLAELAKLSGVSFDTARVDGTDGVPRLVRSLPAGRVWFGSHAPFLIPEAALIRVHESGQLTEVELRGVLGGNSARGNRE